MVIMKQMSLNLQPKEKTQKEVEDVRTNALMKFRSKINSEINSKIQIVSEKYQNRNAYCYTDW